MTESKSGVGLINEKDKKLFNQTIEKEKNQVLRDTMSHVYENAYELFRQGRYQDSLALLDRILSVDPGFEKARFLHSALSGANLSSQAAAGMTMSAKDLIRDRFYQAIETYREGRKVEAIERFQEVLALDPKHRKAKFYVDKINSEIAKEYFEKGKLSYTQGQWESALEDFYTAVNLDPRGYSFLSRQITELESDVRSRKLQAYLSDALKQLSDFKWEESRQTARRIFDFDPSNPRANEIIEKSLKGESDAYFTRGDRLLAGKDFDGAVSAYNHMLKMKHRTQEASKKIELVKDNRKKESERKRKLEEEEAARLEAEQRAQEAAEKQQQEDAAKKPQADNVATSAQESAQASEDAQRAADSHYQQGIQFYQLGQLQQALAELGLALKFDPNHQNAYAAKRRIEAELSR